ncbi:MAG: septum formation family protein [Propionicimonas sp.]
MRRELLWVSFALATSLAACTPSVGPTVAGTGISSTVVASSAQPVAVLEVGDCTGPVDLTGASISSLPAIPCGQSHYYEVHAIVVVTGDAYPGASSLADQAARACAPSFVDYVGVAPEYGRYASAYIAPDEAAWTVPGNRMITCLVGSADGGLVGSAKGDYLVFPKPGQCTGPQNVPALEVEIIDCALPHSYEVFAAKKVDGKVAPTKTELDKLFASVCQVGFTDFVGIEVGKSKYEVTYFLAASDVWTKVADHRIVCSAGIPSGGIRGSLEGVKK